MCVKDECAAALLRYLEHHCREGNHTPKREAIQKYLAGRGWNLSVSGVTRIMDKLEKEGLIVRWDEGDGVRYRVHPWRYRTAAQGKILSPPLRVRFELSRPRRRPKK